MSNGALYSHKRLTVDELRTRTTLKPWPEAAGVLGISRSLVYKSIADGTLPALHFGNRVVISASVIRGMLGIEDTPS